MGARCVGDRVSDERMLCTSSPGLGDGGVCTRAETDRVLF
jgi:hypothetical protein